jgi:GPH family glycoside/pentoside/hexuronide:cation symporter
LIATYAIGQLGWSICINILGTTLVYFYNPPAEARLPYLVSQEVFFLVFTVVTLLAAGGRLFEAFIDPYAASLSDRLRHPRGRRLPLMKWAWLPMCVAVTLLFSPPVGEPSAWNVVWIAACQLVFYTAFAFYVMPHNALLIELGHNEQERLTLSTWISITYAGGIIVCSFIPALAEGFQAGAGLAKLPSYQLAIGCMAAVAGLCMVLPVLTIDERRYCEAQPSEQAVWQSLRATWQNPRFRLFVLSDCLYWVALTIIETGFLYYVTVLVGKPESFLGQVLPVMLIASFAVYPFIAGLTLRFGKKNLIQLAFLIFGLVFGMTYFLGKLPFPTDVQIYTLAVLAGIPAAVLGILPNTVLADIAELDSLETGTNREGMFFGARTTFMKLGQTAGIVIFASLLTLGKDAAHDTGIRLSGVAGVVLAVAAFLIFRPYDDPETLRRIAHLRSLRAAASVPPTS